MIPIGALPLGAFREHLASREERPPPILADYVDPNTGRITKLLTSRSPVDGAIIEGLRVERGSGAAVVDVGQSLREIRHTDDASLGEVFGRAQDGVRELERLGLARLQSVKTTLVEPDTVEVEATILDFTLAASDPNAEGGRTRTYAVPRGSD